MQGSYPVCTAIDTDKLIALYNASRRHVILTCIFLLVSARPSLKRALTAATATRLQRRWEVACGLSLEPLHIWSSADPLCSDAVQSTFDRSARHKKLVFAIFGPAALRGELCPGCAVSSFTKYKLFVLLSCLAEKAK